MSEETNHVKKVHRTAGIPRREADLLTVTGNVVVSWRKNEGMTLKWTNVDALDSTMDAFRESYRAGTEGKGERRVVTRAFAVTNNEINHSLNYVKGYLDELFGKEHAVAYYEQFGIIKANRSYVMPADGDRRLEALELMLASLNRYKMTTQKYGLKYWTDLSIRFGQARDEAAAIDGVISQQVADKTNYMKQIRKTFNALIHLIHANYPDTWKEELRVWGFHKEKY